eukprot:Gregarina_sp_Poly_1__3069@NODE_1864_length_3166_cov_25_051630_g1209_i0_p1_GENE_NODE_1864_length_3166_cov_25_051630_g1209_i0NODE_1864_length_3166_cov_25_051630_g1209_i0_p1_ORF_typecomplete_len698_score95_95EP400_N/PF15790_5/2_1e03EP400_N/PF15790_5/0_094_NODE_1864_length_3166_cov_25_051630_g1209_i07532846
MEEGPYVFQRTHNKRLRSAVFPPTNVELEIARNQIFGIGRMSPNTSSFGYSSRSSSEFDSENEAKQNGDNVLLHGFPMPFYLSEQYGGLPVALREKDASPITGFVWLRGETLPVGTAVTVTEELQQMDKPAHLDWVINLHGEVVPGITLSKQEGSNPLVYYLLADNQFYPMAYQADGTPLEGFVHHPDDSSVVIPVGLQHYESGEKVKHKVINMEGALVEGIPAHPENGWSTHYIKSLRDSFLKREQGSLEDNRSSENQRGDFCDRRQTSTTADQVGMSHLTSDCSTKEIAEPTSPAHPEMLPSSYTSSHHRVPSVTHVSAVGAVKHTKVIETKVPVVHEQVVERVVEVKQPTQINTRSVEVPFCEDRFLYKTTRQVIDVPVEVVREVKKPLIRPVERIVNVPGHVIEVPKPFQVSKQVPKHIIHDKKQLWRISESSKHSIIQEGLREVECILYQPEVHIVDVPVPKKVFGMITQGRTVQNYKNIDELPTPHWNTLVYKCNEALANGSEGVAGVNCLPFNRNPSGTISVLATNSFIGVPIGAPYLAEPAANVPANVSPNSMSGQRGSNTRKTTALTSTTTGGLTSTTAGLTTDSFVQPTSTSSFADTLPVSGLKILRAPSRGYKELLPAWCEETNCPVTNSEADRQGKAADKSVTPIEEPTVPFFVEDTAEVSLAARASRKNRGRNSHAGCQTCWCL